MKPRLWSSQSLEGFTGAWSAFPGCHGGGPPGAFGSCIGPGVLVNTSETDFGRSSQPKSVQRGSLGDKLGNFMLASSQDGACQGEAREVALLTFFLVTQLSQTLTEVLGALLST